MPKRPPITANLLARLYLHRWTPVALTRLLGKPKYRRIIRQADIGMRAITVRSAPNLSRRRIAGMNELRKRVTAIKQQGAEQKHESEYYDLVYRIISLDAKNAAAALHLGQRMNETETEASFDKLADSLRILRFLEIDTQETPERRKFFAKTTSEIVREADKISSRGARLVNRLRIGKLIADVKEEALDEIGEKMRRAEEIEKIRDAFGNQ